ncbi:MAG: hypothetical protein GF383_10715 [Candidatus Lokiarchaeota archaeon]|nr:hypothetical protein [Candidatus Lokiarchaeota archaeon]MBD3341065.1 hypothetical protein [Candidatus Lokiarchaeota archaeon]
METRMFGRTGSEVSIVALGGCGPGYVEQEEADEAVRSALDAGVNMIDIAPTYGKAENRLKHWIQKDRNQFFIAEKTLKRKKRGAWRELNKSLERLGTDHFDLYQFHAVASLDELETILGKGGAMEAFKEAKEAGLIKHIGITAHDDVRVLQKAIEFSDEIDTILMPVYAGALVSPHPANDFRQVLQLAQERNIGITAIKSIAKGRWNGEKTFNTWYKPLEDQNLIDYAVWFTLSQEGVTTYSLPCDVRLWSKVLNAVTRYRKLSFEEQQNFVDQAKKSDFHPLYPE